MKQATKIPLFFLITLAFCALFPVTSSAVVSPWVEDQYSKARLVVGGWENDTYYAGVEIIAQPKWKMYWRTPGDAGFPPSFDWSGANNIQKADILWPVPKREVEAFEGGKLESYVYQDRLFLPLIIHPNDRERPMSANLRLDYGVCNQICVPATAKFALDVPELYSSSEELALIKGFLALIPKTNDDSNTHSLIIKQQDWIARSGKQYIAVQVETDKPFRNPDMFLETKGMFRFSAPKIVYADDTHATFYSQVKSTLNKTQLLQGNVIRITVVNGDNAVETNFTAEVMVNDAPSASFTEWMTIVWLAFLGGLILNVMPCVLPVLSIKLLSVLQQGGAELHEVQRGFLASAVGVLVSFLFLAVVTIGFKASGQMLGWGFHFQNPLFLISLVVILVLFASNLIGRFEINLPGGVTDFLIHKTPIKHHSMLGDFTAGVFATILATPCTAPFLGTAVSFALSREAWDILVIFAFMGLGLAFPYLIFSLFPRWVTKLPRPGAWMAKVKYVLALLLLVTAVWLLWVLSHSLGMRAAIIVFLSVLLIKFLAELKAKKGIRLAGLALVFAVIFTVPFMVTKQDLAKKQLAESVWTEFDEQSIPILVGQGNVVFVDVTADWCLTCKFNKLWVLSRIDVMQHFKDIGVVAMRADITRPNPLVLDYLKRYDRYGIPFNIVYGPSAPEGIPLSELLTVKEVDAALKEAAGKH